MAETDLLLPPGTVLLHIGPHKTGTTALQGALRLAREAMAAHGVVYAGTSRQHYRAALAVTGGKGLHGDPPVEPHHWERLVEQVAAAPAGARVIVSSEYFDDADTDTARRVVEELGGARVHVLVTLRPLAKILPSAWQQYVRNRLRASYDEWLDAMLRKPPYRRPTTTFWQRHHHDVLVDRWASVAGPSNVTVVVVDDTDRGMLLRTVEALVGLPAGFLEEEHGWTNRSLTYAETEVVRHLNVEVKRQGWPDELYRTYVREGVVEHLQRERRPGPDEPPISTPNWALERVAEIGGNAAEKIGASGVRVVGDLSALGAVPADVARRDEPLDPDAGLRPDVVRETFAATVVAGGAFDDDDDEATPEQRTRAIRSGELAGIVGRRLLRRVGRSGQRAAAASKNAISSRIARR